MNSGSFFRLDLKTSKVVNGITYYNYIDAPDLSAKEDEHRYPVKLTISSDSVLFYVHYYKNREVPRHIEDIILKLPFCTNNNDELSSNIKRIYKTEFPFSDYLVDLLTKRYVEKNGDYEPFQKSQINKDSYSSLCIWGLVENQADGSSLYEIRDGKEKITKFLRKLLLDFMFDMMHSDVFESSKYYTQMRDGLMADFFFSSIIKKTEYYYYRRLIRSRYMLDDSNDSLNSIKNLYAHHLDDAEVAWMEAIMNPLADKHFSFTPEWFEDQVPRHKRKSFSVSETWFVNPEEEMARILFPLEEEEKKPQSLWKRFLSTVIRIFSFKDHEEKIHFLNSFELSELIGSKDNTSVMKRQTRVSRWFYRRFDFDDTFRLHLFDNWNQVFAGLLLVFCIVALFPCFWACPRNIALFPAVAAVGFFLTGVWFAVCNKKRKVAKTIDELLIDEVLLNNRRKNECRKSFRYMLIFALASALIFFYDYLSASLLLVIGKFAVLIVGSLLLLRFTRPRTRLINNIHLLLPRLVASITTAWVMLVIGNDLIKERLSWPIWIIILIIVFSFILYENNKALPNITTRARIWRALELMLISFSISLIVGVFAVDVLTPSFMHDAGELSYIEVPTHYPWPFLENTDELALTIYPKYLIQFSFLAMFIGVFIQMIFEEKSITEM